MLALPFVVFLVWRLMAPDAGPPLVLVLGVTGAVAAMTVLLLVLWYQDASPPGTGYVPARLEDGRIVPGRVEQPVPGRVEQPVPGRVEQPAPGHAP
jgi:hypothetical protein